MFAACEQTETTTGSDIQYIPFQETVSSGWGLIGTDGQVLVNNEFKNMPTVVMHNRFFAKNKTGKWELYSVDGNIKQIPGEYTQVGAFIEEVAPVVEEGRSIEFIDVNGKVVFVLDHVDGKDVSTCTNFSDGVAVFRAGKYCGAINTKGDVIAPARYIEILPANEGKMLALDKKNERFLLEGNADNIEYTVISNTGQELGTIPMRRFKIASQMFSDGALVVTDESGDGSVRTGLIDEKGDWIVKASENIKSIKAIQNKTFIYSDGDAYGVMDFQGQQVVRPRYANLIYATEDGLLFAKSDKEKAEYRLLDNQEGQVGREVFTNVLPFIGTNAMVQENGTNWILINAQGEDQKIKQDIFNLSQTAFGDYVLVSERVDYESFIASLKLSKDGFLGMTLSMDAQHVAEAVSTIEQGEPVTGIDATAYVNTPMVMGRCVVDGINLTYSANFDEQMASMAGTVASFKTITPNQMGVEIPATGMLRGKSGVLARDLISRAQAFGQLLNSNQNAAIVQVGEAAYFIANTGTSVYVVYGYLDVSQIDIDQYANIVDRDDAPVNRYEAEEIFGAIADDGI